jgi:hypothetical protein
MAESCYPHPVTLRSGVRAATVVLALASLIAGTVPTVPARRPRVGTAAPLVDQGLNPSEEAPFATALKVLLKDRNTDMVVTVRKSRAPRGGCKKRGTVYWVYSKRGTICFTRRNSGAAWRFSVQVVRGRNPIRKQSATALATLAAERAASSFTDETEPRNLIKSADRKSVV